MTVWDDAGRPAQGGRGAAGGGERPRHEPRLPLHRPARLGPVQRRGRVRRRAAVRGGPARLRHLPRLPHRARRLPRRRLRGPHRAPLDRHQRGARPGPPLRAEPGRPALADRDRRGRRPAHRGRLQRAAQGDRGAGRADRLDALHPHRRGRAADDPLALPADHPDHPDRRRRRRLPAPHRGRQRGAGVVRRPRQPGPHRPGPRAGPRRGHPQPAPRGGRDPRPAHLARRLHEPRVDPQRRRQAGGRGDHRPSSTPATRPTSTRRTAWSSAAAGPASTPRPCATWRRTRRPAPSGATSTSSTAA